MKINDLILVMENIKGKKVNYLSTLDDYIKVVVAAYPNDPENLALAVVALLDTKEKVVDWSEIYFAMDKSTYARFCYSETQLREFLSGEFNQGGKFTFDGERCSIECLDVLEVYDLKTDGQIKIGSCKYKELQYNFQAGEIIHNMNGRAYRILEVLTESNLLLMSMRTGEISVGVDTRYYAKIPKGADSSNDSIRHGVEWSHGIYLGNKITKIDFDKISKEYGRPERILSLEDYRSSLKKVFQLYKKLIENENIGTQVREAAKNCIYEEFETAKESTFLENLEKGQYDSGFWGKENVIVSAKNEKSR